MRPSVRAGLAALPLLLPFVPAPGRADDPLLEYRTIDLPHFRLTFPDVLERVARRTARHLERAHRTLVPILGYEPEQRTEVVLTDDTDSSNGSSTALPFNTLRLFAVPPADMSTLQNYDDWMLMLILHEYTHLLHLDHWGGIPAVINALLGKVWAPNHVNPRFVIEGYAVLQESRRTGRGRLGSTQWEMYLRAAVLEDRLLRLDEIVHVPNEWPHGEVPYLYGAYLVDFLVRRHGEDVLARIAEDYGSDLLPFGVNRAVEEATGESWTDIYEAWAAELRDRFETQAAVIRAEGQVEGRRVVLDAETVRTPRWRPDGRRIGCFVYDGYDQPALVEVDPETAERVPLAPVTGHAGMTWGPDGRTFVYHRADVYRGLYGFYDIYAHTADGREVRLTEGLRAREPDLDPGGRRVVYALTGPSGGFLAAMNSDGAGTEILLSGVEESQVFTPRWRPDGGAVVFSAWIPGGERDLFLLELEPRRLVRLTRAAGADASPVFSPDGRLVYFSSDRTGIADLYALEPDSGRTWRVTHALGGAFQPDVSPDGTRLAYVGFTASGYDLRVLPVDRAAWVEVPGDVPEPVERLGGTLEPFDDPAPGVPASRPYDPWQTAAPRSWFLQVADGGDQYQASFSVAGNDVVGHHALSAALSVGLEDGTLGWNAGYGYYGWYPALSAVAWHGDRPRNDLRIDGEQTPWRESSYGGRLEVSLPWLRNDWAQWFTLQYRVEWTEPSGGDFEVPLDPNHRRPVFPDTGLLSGVTLSWYFSTLRGATYVYGRSHGFSLGLDLHMSDPVLGSDYRLIEVRTGGAAFFAAPWFRAHTFALRLSGGIGRSDYRSRGVFFLGGLGEQDFFRGIFYGEAQGAPTLRGYEPWSVYGSRFLQGNLEYRIPIVDIDAGIGTVPGFLRRLAANVFCDAGAAGWEEMAWDEVKVGAGAELFLEASLGWYLDFTLRAGYAYGFMDPGGHDLYLVLGTPF